VPKLSIAEYAEYREEREERFTFGIHDVVVQKIIE
jgi:hypothetical protein